MPGQPLVGAVNGERVLDEVVHADAQEIGFGRQLIHRERGGRDLNHRADRHHRVGAERGGDLADDRARVGDLGRGRHERQQDAKRAGISRTEQGADLRPEAFVGVQRAPAHACIPDQTPCT